MWYEKLPPDAKWSLLWCNYIRCDSCNGIRPLDGPCPACGTALDKNPDKIRLGNGEEYTVNRAYRGGETRYEDFIYLELLEREWTRMSRDQVNTLNGGFLADVSEGASIVLIFWSYFESRIDYLLRSLLGHIPIEFLDDSLKRYSSISSRINDFYKIAFKSTYFNDLEALDYVDVKDRLKLIRERRNSFVHGNPRSIDDNLVRKVVEFLEREHEAWIAVYNHRIASQS